MTATRTVGNFGAAYPHILNAAGAVVVFFTWLAANPFSGIAEMIAPEPRAILRRKERLFVLIVFILKVNIKDKENKLCLRYC
jgi:uncharacterized membrane protein